MPYNRAYLYCSYRSWPIYQWRLTHRCVNRDITLMIIMIEVLHTYTVFVFVVCLAEQWFQTILAVTRMVWGFPLGGAVCSVDRRLDAHRILGDSFVHFGRRYNHESVSVNDEKSLYWNPVELHSTDNTYLMIMINFASFLVRSNA